MPKNTFNTAVLGAGAAGLFCAANMPDTDKIIIDHNKSPGLKILASGGGNCNFTNKNISIKNYLSQNPRFCASALAGFSAEDFLNLLRKKRIAFEERERGQYFAFGSKTILDMLLSLYNKNNTVMALENEITGVTKQGDLFEINCKNNTFYAKNVVVALGGKSYHKLGASEKAYQIAQSFGISHTPLYPALTGVSFDEKTQKEYAHLAGISCQAKAACGKNTTEGGVLFTHEGLSGPAVFRLSLYGIKNKEVKINFLPQTDMLDFFMKHKESPQKIHNILETFLPSKLAFALCGGSEVRLADAKKAEIQKIAQNVNAFTFIPKDTSGYDRAEITAGGIDTKAVSSKTMEAKDTKGLYFIGECLDVSGDLGGFNLHWAWASAIAAAKDIERKHIIQ